MRMRLCSAMLGVAIAVFGATGSAQARPEKTDAYSTRNYGSVTRANMGKNFKAKSQYRYAGTKSGKRYTPAKPGKKYRAAN